MKTKLQIIQEADHMFFEASSGVKHSDSITDHGTDDLINGRLKGQEIAMAKKGKIPTEGEKDKVIEDNISKVKKTEAKRSEDFTPHSALNASDNEYIKKHPDAKTSQLIQHMKDTRK